MGAALEQPSSAGSAVSNTSRCYQPTGQAASSRRSTPTASRAGTPTSRPAHRGAGHAGERARDARHGTGGSRSRADLRASGALQLGRGAGRRCRPGRRAGADVTLVAYDGTLRKALEAAGRLASEGIDAEVIDLRTLRPLDDETLVASVEKTRRAVIVDEGGRSGGLSAEISARHTERLFYVLEPRARWRAT
jgi:hypothetical protein